jgi:hypothetical protein
VTEHGRPSACEYGGHQATLQRDAAVADREYPTMHAMQPFRLNPVLTSSGTDPMRSQLAAGYHPVLAIGELGDNGIR